jgi:hypothetical protein
MATTLKISTPLSIGDIIGRGFRIFRMNVGLIAKVLLLPTILLCFGRVFLTVGIANVPKATLSFFSLEVVAFVLAGILVLIVGGFMFYMRQLALVRFFMGFSDSYKDADKFMGTRYWTLTGLMLATMAAVVIIGVFWGIGIGLCVPMMALKGAGMAAGLLGASLGVLGFLGCIVFISVAAQISMSCMAMESDDLGTIITHSAGLTARSFWRSIAFLTVTGVAVSLVAYPLCLPIVVAVSINSVTSGILNGSHQAGAQLPIALQVFNQLWEQMMSMIVAPISHICYGLYYCDLRMRQEGLDLVERAKSFELQSSNI